MPGMKFSNSGIRCSYWAGLNMTSDYGDPTAPTAQTVVLPRSKRHLPSDWSTIQWDQGAAHRLLR